MKRKAINLCMLFGLLLAVPSVAQTIFTEVTAESGYPPFNAEGIAAGDFNNDGWPDLAMTEGVYENTRRLLLLQNQGQGHFADRTALIQGPITSQKKGGGLCFAAYDNDGDLDLFVPVGHVVSGWRERDLLLRNDRGLFTDVALEAGLTEVLPSYDATWLDYDRDGHLDLYVGHFVVAPDDSTVRSRLYHNRGDGTFEDLTQQAGLDIQFSTGGGSFGGMVANDFNDDGWPDLYVGVRLAPNRLFLNDGQGHFRDATTSEIADPGVAGGTAVGDIDHDGDLDIFQAAGNDPQFGLVYRSLLLLNLGGAQFLDVTDGVGLTAYFGKNTFGPALADLDNDGHLDLMTSQPAWLYLNHGDGISIDQTEQSGFGGLDIGGGMTLGDYNLDGFLDVVFNSDSTFFAPPSFGKLYRNNGNDNHHLQMEVVGVKSNRTGIGARLVVTSGVLKQIWEISSAMGVYHEMIAHFGLGTQTHVDTLEIRWPSGQVDMLTDIPADQKIRVLEGSGRYYRVEPTRWQQAPPETLVAGTTPQLNLAIQPALFDPEAHITRVTADLSSLGGGAEVPLAAEGDGTYHLRDFPFPITAPNGVYTLHMMIDQSTSLGPYWTRLSRQVTVVPGGDLVVFDEALAQDWQTEGNSRIKRLDLSETGVVHRGRLAGAFAGDGGGWTVTFKPPAPISPVGYTALRFAFHPGEVVPSSAARFTVTLIPGKTLSLLDSSWVELNKKAWQVVEIPVDAFGRTTAPIESIVFTGNLAGTFYLDDLRLVAATPPPPTLVEEDRTAALPQSFALSQNFPNPFNSDTAIRFALPEGGQVELVVYDIAGQRVSKLVEGQREAGSYTIRWDGRDGHGRDLASGIYLYRLRVGERMETRKLVLLR